MGLPWILVGGWSPDTRTVASAKPRDENEVLIYYRPRNMVRAHPSTGQSHRGCSSFRLLIDRRSVVCSVQMQKAEASPGNDLGYVPYQLWVEADPRITSLLQNSIRSFRHELRKTSPTLLFSSQADQEHRDMLPRRVNADLEKTNSHTQLQGHSYHATAW